MRLSGWIHRRRRLRDLTFVVLRDRSGLAQVVVRDPAVLAQIDELGEETTVDVAGTTSTNSQAPGGVEIVEPVFGPLGEPSLTPPIEIWRPSVTAGLPTMLDYRVHVENKSLYNTPNTGGIYIFSLVCKWLQEKGGVAAMERENDEKAGLVYDAIDATDFYRGHADVDCRSPMNVTFRLPAEDLEKKFVAEATAQGLDGLKGHRSVGGIRASIYNAFPRAGVEALVSFMKDFERRNG